MKLFAFAEYAELNLRLFANMRKKLCSFAECAKQGYLLINIHCAYSPNTWREIEHWSRILRMKQYIFTDYAEINCAWFLNTRNCLKVVYISQWIWIQIQIKLESKSRFKKSGKYIFKGTVSPVFLTRLLTSEDEYKWFWHQMIYFPGTINIVSTRLYCHISVGDIIFLLN